MLRVDPRSEPWFDRDAYPFADRHLEVDGGRMHYLDEGQGPAVVLVHGTPGWTFEFGPLVRALVAAGRRVIAPDHIGFGLSDRPDGWSYALPDHTANLRALLAHVGIDRADLVVHDFGGPIALPIALDDPGRVGQLVLVNTWLWPLGAVDGGFARQRWLLRSGALRLAYRRLNFSARVIVKSAWGRHRPLSPRHHRHYWGMHPDAGSRAGTLGFLRAVTEADDLLAGYAARAGELRRIERTLIVWGGADGFIPQAHADHWRQVQPAAEWFGVDDAGHFPHDEAADLVVPRVVGFLGRG